MRDDTKAERSNSQHTDQEGVLLDGRYRLLEPLGEGGMATVHRAIDVSLERYVAVKILHPTTPSQRMADAERADRFRHEAQALAQLNHAHIVTLFDHGQLPDGGNYLVMEYVPGGTLSEVLKAGQRLSAPRTLRLANQLCRALRYAHRRGLIHRDVKLANILLTQGDGEEAKLVDFGLVKMAGDEGPTKQGMILGSAHCMAPEQINGRVTDQRTDLYALGVVLFRVLTGRYPFWGGEREMLAAHLYAEVPSFAEVAPSLDCPKGLEQLVRRLMAKDPADRFDSADQVLVALSRIEAEAEQEVTFSRDRGAALVPPRSAAGSWRWVVLAVPGGVILLSAALLGGAIAVLLSERTIPRAQSASTEAPAPLPGPEPAPEPPAPAVLSPPAAPAVAPQVEPPRPSTPRITPDPRSGPGGEQPGPEGGLIEER